MDLSFSLVTDAASVPPLFDHDTPPVAPNAPIPNPPPKYQKNVELTCDQRRNIACNVRATPQKKAGRHPVLTQAQVEELVEFVCASRQNRQISFAQLAEVLDFGVMKDAIRSALAR
ncbi:hypothetical protein Golomagni_01008 [Golovinomyces magnicellulatus]|nr:hypothetical protein Golomagni_01008 [Golovinomyces magnicellulatus]